MTHSTARHNTSIHAKHALGIDHSTPKSMLDFGHALLVIAGSDGEVSDDEMQYLVELQRHFGAPEEVLTEYAKFDYKKAKLTEILNGLTQFSGGQVPSLLIANHLIYQAIRMCSLDKYGDQERKKILEAATQMKVPEKTVASLHALVEMEHAVDKIRKALLSV